MHMDPHTSNGSGRPELYFTVVFLDFYLFIIICLLEVISLLYACSAWATLEATSANVSSTWICCLNVAKTQPTRAWLLDAAPGVLLRTWLNKLVMQEVLFILWCRDGVSLVFQRKLVSCVFHVSNTCHVVYLCRRPGDGIKDGTRILP